MSTQLICKKKRKDKEVHHAISAVCGIQLIEEEEEETKQADELQMMAFPVFFFLLEKKRRKKIISFSSRCTQVKKNYKHYFIFISDFFLMFQLNSHDSAITIIIFIKVE